MSEQLNRYENNHKIVSHLASGYVLGLLPERVRHRVESLIVESPHGALNKAIRAFENKMSPLDEQTPERQPLPATWQGIEQRLNQQTDNAELPATGESWLTLVTNLFSHKLVTAMSLAVAMVLAVYTVSYEQPEAQLSYIAVMSSNDEPQLIAATYGHNKELALDVLSLPEVPEESDLELWVVSKTDKMARSLGVIDSQPGSQKRILSEAEWRLIKDSDSLILTLEDKGGSPFGEPSSDIVSRGLCIQMPSWKEEV